MSTSPFMDEFKVVNVNVRNGAIDTYTISFRSKIPHTTGDILSFKFPPEIIMQSNSACVPLGIPSGISCTRVGTDVIEFKMTFSTTDITAGTSVSFQITNVKNPPDTRITSSFSLIKITDSTGNLQLTSFTGTANLATSEFANVITRSLSQSDKTLLSEADYSITYTTIN